MVIARGTNAVCHGQRSMTKKRLAMVGGDTKMAGEMCNRSEKKVSLLPSMRWQWRSHT